MLVEELKENRAEKAKKVTNHSKIMMVTKAIHKIEQEVRVYAYSFKGISTNFNSFSLIVFKV